MRASYILHLKIYINTVLYKHCTRSSSLKKKKICFW